MRAPEGTVSTFDPGALCLEFLVTGGPGRVARHEVLHRPADLATWISRSRLRLPAGQLVVSPADVGQARVLRDALWRLARSWITAEPGEPADLAVLNHGAAAPDLAPLLHPDGRLGWVLPAGGSQALATIARDAITLRKGPYRDRVRECAAHDCFLVFVDVSRPGRRRWCSMQRCGNRQKARLLRARQPCAQL
jgi:predicted RNA-binding Zn ribbon-like protein